MTSHRYSPLFPAIYLLADLLVLNFSFYLSNALKFSSFVAYTAQLMHFQILMNVFWVGLFLMVGLWNMDRDRHLLEHLNDLLTAMIMNIGLWLALWFLVQPVGYPRSHLFFTYFFAVILFVSWRVVWHYAIRHYRTKGFNVRNVIVIGGNRSARAMVHHMKKEPELGYKLLKVFDDLSVLEAGDAKNELISYVAHNKVDVIFCSLNQLDEGQMSFLINLSENHLIKLKVISQFSKSKASTVDVKYVGGITVLDVNVIPLDFKVNRFFKRAFDLVFASVFVGLVFPWLLPLVALAIKIESKGPIFFVQQRNGRGNQPFSCYKFRTMRVNNEADTKQATKGDSRITKIGAILRKTSIDEIPQFLNVLKGDMSVVGPRPHPIKLNESYKSDIEKFAQRHAIKPGITGLAQAKGFRGETTKLIDMSARVRLDRFYVKNWSIWLDFKILVLTVISILQDNENAY